MSNYIWGIFKIWNYYTSMELHFFERKYCGRGFWKSLFNLYFLIECVLRLLSVLQIRKIQNAESRLLVFSTPNFFPSIFKVQFWELNKRVFVMHLQKILDILQYWSLESVSLQIFLNQISQDEKITSRQQNSQMKILLYPRRLE